MSTQLQQIWQELQEAAYLRYPEDPKRQRAYITGFLIAQVQQAIRRDSASGHALKDSLDASRKRSQDLGRTL